MQGYQLVLLAVAMVCHMADAKSASPVPRRYPTPTAPTLYVATNGSDYDGCGSARDPCRSIVHATEQAAPFTIIRVAGGSYGCGAHVTTPVSIIADASDSAPVVMDCEGRGRALWFDEVAAHVEGVHFRNGAGEGAGCVLVTLHTDHHHERNNFTRCSFTRCTATSSPRHPHVGGALAVQVLKSNGRAYEVKRSTFDRNYGRSDRVAAGAVAVVYGGVAATNTAPATRAQQYDDCTCYLFEALNTAIPEVNALGGVYSRVAGLVTDGRPVYNSRQGGGLPRARGDVVHWLLFCAARGVWGFQTTTGEVDLMKLSACECVMCSNVNDRINRDKPVGQIISWSYRAALVDRAIQLICEDPVASCRNVQLSSIPMAQIARGGVFTMVDNLTKAGRPVFRNADGAAPSAQQQHWIWYCLASFEWIVTEDDPRTVALDPASSEGCVRGVASGATYATHPLSVAQWKYWDNSWRVSALPRFGGIAMTCAGVEEQACDDVQLFNAPATVEVAASSFARMRNSTWNGRPVYSNQMGAHSQYLWFCGQFQEWMVGAQEPHTITDANDQCMRSLSSHATAAHAPYLGGVSWAYSDERAWVSLAAPTTARCVTSCSAFTLDVSRGVESEASGHYRRVGTFNNANVYRKQRAPHYVVYRQRPHGTGRWAIGRGEHPGKVGAADVLYVGNERAGVVTSHPFAVGRWVPRNSVAVRQLPHLVCSTHQTCASVNVSKPAGYTGSQPIHGTYVRTRKIVAGRATYALGGRAVAPAGGAPDGEWPFLYYCAEDHRWVIGPINALCVAWVWSKFTLALVPTMETVWVAPEDGRYWKRPSKGNGKLSVVCGGEMPAAHPPFISKSAGHDVSTVIDGCNFTSNMALGGAGDGAAASGAVMLSLGTAAEGDDHHGMFKRVSVTNNEAAHVPALATATHIAGKGNRDHAGAVYSGQYHRTNEYRKNYARAPGGILIYNTQLNRRHTHNLFDVTLQHNVGQVGGIAIEGVYATLHKSAIKRNTGLQGAGGMALTNANVSLAFVACSFNYAALAGGCATVDSLSRLTASRADFNNNSAALEGTTIASSGKVNIVDSHVERMHDMAITSLFLTLSQSDLSCLQGIATSHVGGFGCVYDPPPNIVNADGTHSPEPLPQLYPDENEMWWIYMATSSSTLAQVMLCVTISVFAYQQMALYLANNAAAAAAAAATAAAAQQQSTANQGGKRTSSRR
jgi:hypothetical protein